MKRLFTYPEKAADALSALMLFLAVVLAGGYGPLVSQAPPIPVASQSSPASAGTGGHRSTPVISKQQLVVTESRELAATGWDDGKPKTILAGSFQFAPHFTRATGTGLPPVRIIGTAASPFHARGPPFHS